MTSDAKIGLLLGLVFIFIIAFVVNGLPRLRSEPDGNELTVISAEGIVTAENTVTGLGARERSTEEVFSTRILQEQSVQDRKPDTRLAIPTAEPQTNDIEDPDVRYQAPLTLESPVTNGLIGGLGTPNTSFARDWIRKSPNWVVQSDNPVGQIQNITGGMQTSRPSVEDASKEIIPVKPATKPILTQPGRVTITPQPTINSTAPQKSDWTKTYVVTSGDNLGVIAKKVYGEELGNKIANVNLIFKANNGILASPDQVKVGQKLTIPVLPGLAQTQTNSIFPKSLVETVKSIGQTHLSTEGAVRSSDRYYVAIDGDSLWKIASGELGKGSRYSEIFELNSDIMKNPENVVPGMRLRMPAR